MYVRTEHNVRIIDVAQFVLEMEKLKKSLYKASYEKSLEDVQQRAQEIAAEERGIEATIQPGAPTGCYRRSQLYLRDYYDDKLAIPFESTIVIVSNAAA